MRVCAAVVGGVLLLSMAAAASARVPGAALDRSYKQVCKQVKPGFMHCNAEVAVRGTGAVKADFGFGYGPADLQKAYGMTSAANTRGGDQTIAIIDAFDAPRAEADLAVYRAQYGLPPCTSAGGCFRKVDQRGGTDYPQADGGWAGEIALDLDMVSAIAPRANLLLVEADSNYPEDLGDAVDQAVALGARFVNNSYGTDREYPDQGTLDVHYDHPGVAIVAASGDLGYGVSYPAASS